MSVGMLNFVLLEGNSMQIYLLEFDMSVPWGLLKMSNFKKKKSEGNP